MFIGEGSDMRSPFNSAQTNLYQGCPDECEGFSRIGGRGGHTDGL